MQLSPARHERRAVERLELVELAAVQDPRQHVTGVERLPEIGGDHAEQVVGVVQRLGIRRRRRRPELLPVEPAHDLPAEPDGVELVDSEVVGKP